MTAAVQISRVALGSRTVSVLQFPAWGILTRFHGSAPGRTAAAISSGVGGPGKAERSVSEVERSSWWALSETAKLLHYVCGLPYIIPKRQWDISL